MIEQSNSRSVIHLTKNRMLMRESKIEDLSKNGIYHICTHGFEDTNIMRDDEDFRTAHNLMAILGYKMGIWILAYCLMSNHVHFIIEATTAQSAKAFINEYLRIYSNAIKSFRIFT